MTDEPSADAEPTTIAFNPSIAALASLDAASQETFKKHELKHSDDQLEQLSEALKISMLSQVDLPRRLKLQSHLIDSAFNALLLKSTRYGGIDDQILNHALRTHRQFRMTCVALEKIKKDAEQTERKARAAEAQTQRLAGDGLTRKPAYHEFYSNLPRFIEERADRIAQLARDAAGTPADEE